MAVNVDFPQSPGRPFPILPGENVLTEGNTADLELRIPPTPSGPKRTETAKGRIWVTDHRVIFISERQATSTSTSTGYDAPPTLDSLVIPYSHLLIASFNLPLFAPNNLILSFLPSSPESSSHLPEVGRGGKIEAKLVVGEGAGHGIWKRIEGERSRYVERQIEEESLPVYTAEG
ncbi:hypothetical protein BCR39DRAFT_542733 [Naematelia encephala]|uniref:GRAM domain-containing protein n=1 Tax=Naematelia encephala TaxID=71784 RepID=A0A1Y2ATZ6_9TREE|nr:hypothetical protein BCR39DRAFT_542733 [Naematelia encephala]